ncbi:MAG TPA: TlpA disulfide reductase family protein [Myxococcota bacterium]
MRSDSERSVRLLGLARALLRVVGIAALLAVLAFLLVGGEHPVAAGSKAPPVTAKALDGALVDVGLGHGQITVVNIWGTWCPPCRAEIPDLVRAAHKYQGRVRFIGLAIDSPVPEIEKLVDRMGIPYDIARTDSATLDAWGASSVPDTYIVDGDGIVRWSTRGAIDDKLLDAKLAPVLR